MANKTRSYVITILGLPRSDEHPYGYAKLGYGKDWTKREALAAIREFQGGTCAQLHVRYPMKASTLGPAGWGREHFVGIIQK